jgi:uncharacterized protein
VQPEALQFGEQEMISGMRVAFGVIERHLPKHSLLASLIDKASLSHHQHTCGVGQNYLVIDQHGGIAKCQAAIQQTVTTIAVEDPLQHIREDRKGIQGLAVDEKEGCRACDWRYWCTGGCPLLTYRFTNRYDIKSPNCHIYKALFPEALRMESGALSLIYLTDPFSNTEVTEFPHILCPPLLSRIYLLPFSCSGGQIWQQEYQIVPRFHPT